MMIERIGIEPVTSGLRSLIRLCCFYEAGAEQAEMKSISE